MKNKKEIIFVCQQKGGVGKSILSYMLYNKYQERIHAVYDTDSTNMSFYKWSEKMESPTNIKIFSFFADKTNNEINQQGLIDLIEEVNNTKVEKNKNVFLIDCSSTVSETLISSVGNFSSEDNGLKDILVDQYLRANNIILNFFVVTTGADMFSTTFTNFMVFVENFYNKTLKNKADHQRVKDYVKITCAVNDYKSLYSKEMNNIQKNCKKYDIEHFKYTLTKNKGESTVNLIKEILEKGEGLKSLSGLTKLQFSAQIEKLNIFSKLNI